MGIKKGHLINHILFFFLISDYFVFISTWLYTGFMQCWYLSELLILDTEGDASEASGVKMAKQLTLV